MKRKKVLDQMKQNFDKLDPGSAKFDKAAADIERENAKLSAMEGQLYKVEQALKAVGRENSFSGKMEALGKNLLKVETISKNLEKMSLTLRDTNQRSNSSIDCKCWICLKSCNRL